MFLAVILSFAALSYTIASPILTYNNKTFEDLPAIEELNGNRTTWLANPNGNRTTGLTNFYITTPGVGTHKLHKSELKDWNDARTTCLNEGAHLVVINSAAEEALIAKLMNDNKITGELWIGVHEQFKKDDWVSVKDERLDAIGYIHWRQGEPNNVGNNEHCLVMNQAGVNDQNCAAKFFFVCEI